MKRATTLGVASEILLVAGAVLVFFDVWTNQVLIGCGFGITTNCGSNFVRLIWPIFYLAMVLLFASTAGFLLLLTQTRKPALSRSEAL